MNQGNVDNRWWIKKQLDNAVSGTYGLVRSGVLMCRSAQPYLTVRGGPVQFWGGGSSPERVAVDLEVKSSWFDGTAKLTWNTNEARVWDAQVGGNQLANDTHVDHAHWGGGNAVWVEPIAPGIITLTFTLTKTGDWNVHAINPATGNVVANEVTVAIKNEDDTAPTDWLLAQNERKYKAVLDPDVGGGTYAWTDDGDGLVALAGDTTSTVTVTAGGDDHGDVNLTVTWTKDGRSISETHALTVVQLRIKDEDGSAPKEHALLGAVDKPRQYKAVFEPAGASLDIDWKTTSSGLDPQTRNLETTTVKPRAPGNATITVTSKLDRDPKDQSAKVTHPFKIVALELKDGDGKASPKGSLLKHVKQTYKVVPTPAVEGMTYDWAPEGALGVEEGADEELVTIAGTAKTDGANLEVACTLDGQTVKQRVRIAVTDIAITPAALRIAVNAEGSTATLRAEGTLSAKGCKWTVAPNEANAVIDGADDKQQVKVKGTSPGVVEVKLVYTPDGAVQPLEAKANVAFVGVEIMHQDGSSKPKGFVLRGSERSYKAVLTDGGEGGTFTWKAGAKLTVNGNGATARIAPSAIEGTETIQVTLTLGGGKAIATHEVAIAKLVIKDGDRESDAHVHVLTGQQRTFAAVLTGAEGEPEITWKKSKGANLYDAPLEGATTTITANADKQGPAEITAKCVIDGQTAERQHAFKVVDLAIKDGDGSAPPQGSILKHWKQAYKAVPTPTVVGGEQGFAWGESAGLFFTTGLEQARIELAGAEATGEGETKTLSVEYTLDGQSLTREIPITVTDISVATQVAAVGTSVELEPTGTVGTTGHKWALAENPCEGEIDGASTKNKVKVKAKKPGVVGVDLTFTHANARLPLTATGHAVFIRERVKSFEAELESKKDLAEDAEAKDKKATVLLGLERDPAAWKIGYVVAEAEGKPDKLPGSEAEGTHAWKPKGGGYLKAADTQPDEHGVDKHKVLLVARPKGGNKGPPKDPGYEDDKVEVAYTLGGKEAKDTLAVRVTRYGCSEIKWQRKGKDNLEAEDRIVPCTHRDDPQWEVDTATWVEPPGGDGVEVLESGGHQHGGRCHLCSGVSGQDATTWPRHVWHHVKGTSRVLVEARALADAMRLYALDASHTDVTYNRFFTPAARKHARGKGGKMLGVLVGKDGGDADVWLYALSGKWTANGDWSAALDAGASKTERTIPNYDGTTTTYPKTATPFNTKALGKGFGKLGRCAAQALLAEARAQGLKDLELAEVWLDTNTTLDTTGTFQHKREIGSCEQCRRALGRLLCEVGA